MTVGRRMQAERLGRGRYERNPPSRLALGVSPTVLASRSGKSHLAAAVSDKWTRIRCSHPQPCVFVVLIVRYGTRKKKQKSGERQQFEG